MSFLSFQSIAIAAAATIPPLVALYFLKLKRNVRVVPSTLLWKRAVEDLQVNAPFQRLRRSLLLLLQLLVLIAGALALGRPMFQHVERGDDNIIVLIDQSASMNVVEADGRTRLERAKEQASAAIDRMKEHGRAMIIAFCDRAYVVSPFSTNKTTLKARIQAIEPTDSTTRLGEAVSLAEAYLQNIIIGGEQRGTDRAPQSAALPASVYLYTDGRIADLDHVSFQRLKVEQMKVFDVGARSDNAGIVAMDARRNYERPERLHVFATVRNFGPDPVACDAMLYVDDRNVDVQAVRLEGVPAAPGGAPGGGRSARGAPAAGTVAAVAFDPFEFEGAGVVEVRLMIDDALESDNRAWTLVAPPRDVSVLLVTPGNLFLSNALSTLPVMLTTLTPGAYEAVPDSDLIHEGRSAYDVVILDGHSTGRLPPGAYFFWGAVPRIEGVSMGEVINNEVIFNWDETHPILRHVAVETIDVFQWNDLTLPRDAVSLIDGQSSPVLSLLTRGASQYLICAFRLLGEDDAGNPIMNTYWVTKVHFIVFLQNAVQYLASAISTSGAETVRTGEPMTIAVPRGTRTVRVHRPDGRVDVVPTAGRPSVHYARTRRTGVYRTEPALPDRDRLAVNLFDESESDVAPVRSLTIGESAVTARQAALEVNKPAWPLFLIAMLAILMIEWIIYNRRVLM